MYTWKNASIVLSSTMRATRPLELVHSDLCGPMRAQSFAEHLYFITFIDDFTRLCWVYGLKVKSDAFMAFRQFLPMAENACGHKLITLRTDQGRQYMSHEFTTFMQSCGIMHQCTTPYTPQ